MKISQYLNQKNIFLDAKLPDKEAVLRFIADVCVKNSIVKTAEPLYIGLVEREGTMSTGVGNGIALPHTTVTELEAPVVIIIKPAKPVKFDTLDNRPVDIILGLIFPEDQKTLHIRLLAAVSRLCKNADFLNAMRKSGSPVELHKKIKKLEEDMDFH